VKSRFLTWFGAWAVLAAPASASAQSEQGTPIEIGRSFPFESRTLGETRTIDVSLPEGYETSLDRRYPVLVVLDGEFEHGIAVAIARFYAVASQIPPLIVVGIRNTNRMRDMTPEPVAGFTLPPDAADAGGAERFLGFIADELLPYLDRSYRTAPLRVLAGHSLGGLFALYTLAHRPDLFTGYVVMEPSAWWNNQREFNAAQASLQKAAARRARVMMVNTLPLDLDTTAWGGSRPMVRHLATSGETHTSMAISGMMQGLRTMFADFKPLEWRPGTRPIAMLDRYDSLRARVGYAVPVGAQAFAMVARMSLDSRHFEDAERVLTRMESELGESDESRRLRGRLEDERGTPQPPEFIPLEFPAQRPTPHQARAFLGRWVAMDRADPHEVDVRASGDTIIVHDRIRSGSGPGFEADDPVIRITPDGALEWGLPFFRGLAALLVLKGRVLEDGTMLVTREVRGWVPRGPGPDLTPTDRFRRASP
jgi:predicted alpha/beta superfamily hydrolase